MKEKTFGILYNKDVKNSGEVKDILCEILKLRRVNFEVMELKKLKSGVDFVFVIGGDGTILKAARFYCKTPIFGINLGRLGFLSQTSKENLESSVDKILNGEYEVQKRIMLKGGNYLALNDIVIKGTMTGRTSKFTLQINDKTLCEYLADGIIISTPTGSTAYGLSAGGPIVYPTINAFVIIPICPHTLTARPLVIPDSETITVYTGSDYVKYVASCDGQSFYEFENKIEIKKAEFYAHLAVLKETDFYEILKDKLHWSISPAIKTDKTTRGPI